MPDQSLAAPRRLFIAIMLPHETQQRLASLVRLLDAHRITFRPVRPEALHVTLRFLGEMTAAQEEQIAAACHAACAEAVAFPLTIGGFGMFPNSRRPQVVWLGLLAGAEPMIALQRRIEEGLPRREIVRRHEGYTPHLTLARVRPGTAPAARLALGAAVTALPRSEQAECTARAVSLVHSRLTPGGSHYTVLHEWSLRSRA